MGITYRFRSGRVWLNKVHDVSQDRYGLFQGRVTWMTDPDNFRAAVPAPNSGHPLFPWLELERWSMRGVGAFVAIDGEFFGIEGNESEPIYELGNSAGEFAIEGHPNFDQILSGAGLTLDDVTDEDGKFTGFPAKVDGEDYPGKRNLAGVEAFLSYGEVVWRKIWSARSAPSDSDIQAIGKIDNPDGSPPTPAGRDWILISNPYSQRGKTFQRSKEWKLSGPDGANPDIYSET